MPAPMMTPMPKTVRSRAVRFFLSWNPSSWVSLIECSTDLVLKTSMQARYWSRTRQEGGNRDMAAPDNELVESIRDGAGAAADPAKAEPMQAYMKSEMPFLGIPSPAAQARPCGRILAGHPLRRGDVAGDRARALGRSRVPRGAVRRPRARAAPAHREHRQVHTLGLYEHLVRTGAWWDLVDETATHLVRDAPARPSGRGGPVIREWASADDLWVRRSAIICQVGAGTGATRTCWRR